MIAGKVVCDSLLSTVAGHKLCKSYLSHMLSVVFDM